MLNRARARAAYAPVAAFAAAIALMGGATPAEGAAVRGQVIVGQEAGFVVGDGRVWQISDRSGSGALPQLLSWSLRKSGTHKTLTLGATSTAEGVSKDDLGQVTRKAFGTYAVEDGRLYAEIAVCPPGLCDAPQRRTFTFETDNGSAIAARPVGASPLVRDTVTSAVFLTPAADGQTIALSDPADGQLFPLRPAISAVNGPYAGNFVLQTTGDATGAPGGKGATYTVTNFRTGDVAYQTTSKAILRRAGAPRAGIEGVRLQTNGSLGVRVGPPDALSGSKADQAVRAGSYPVFVDPHGTVRRVGIRLRTARQVQTIPSKSRVLVSSAGIITGSGKNRKAQCKGAWLTNLGGTRGYDLAGEPKAGGLRVAGDFAYWDGTTAIGFRLINGVDRRNRLIVRQLGQTKLHRDARPSCENATTSYRLSRDQPLGAAE